MNKGDVDPPPAPIKTRQYFGSRKKQSQKPQFGPKIIPEEPKNEEDSSSNTVEQKNYSQEFLGQYSRTTFLPS